MASDINKMALAGALNGLSPKEMQRIRDHFDTEKLVKEIEDATTRINIGGPVACVDAFIEELRIVFPDSAKPYVQ